MERCGRIGSHVVVFHGRRFLGDLFAARASRLPQGAVLVGRRPFISVYTVADDPRLLYVRREGHLGRFLALAKRDRRAPPNAYLMGDSVLLDAQAAITRRLRGWNVQFDAGVSRTSFVGIRIAQSLRGQRRDVVVVEFGTNESNAAEFADRARELLSNLRSTRLVVWLDVHGVADYVPFINLAIRRVVAEFPNTEMLVWDAGLPSDAVIGDGVHLNAKGARVMAGSVSGMLNGWLDAANGEGRTACLD